MEFVLVLSLLLNALTQSPTATEDPTDLEVRRFSWSEFRRPTLGDPLRTDETLDKSQRQVFSEENSNKNSVENRSRDMLIMNQRAGVDSRGKPIVEYRYSVEIKNNGGKIVRSIFWEYQSGEASEPDKLQQREFGCLVKIKPAESKNLEAFALLPGSRVINAATGKRPPERVLINRIEYVDGSIWQRTNWTLPDHVIKAATRGGCKALVAS